MNVTAQKYPYRLVAGYRIDSDNQEEVGYLQELNIALSGNSKVTKSKNFESRSIRSGATKKRISGRI